MFKFIEKPQGKCFDRQPPGLDVNCDELFHCIHIEIIMVCYFVYLCLMYRSLDFQLLPFSCASLQKKMISFLLVLINIYSIHLIA